LSPADFEIMFQPAKDDWPFAADRFGGQTTKEKTMTSKDILNQAFKALDNGDYDTVSSLLDHNFRFSGPTPYPLNAQEFIAFERAIRAAFPDVRHNGTVRSESADGWVSGEVRVTGTHKAALEMPYIPKIGATNKKFKLPTERWSAQVQNGKVVSFSADVPADGGLVGILTQIGRDDVADCLKTPGADCRTLPESKGAMYL
jgi:ketosteroid isomerase-like protein